MKTRIIHTKVWRDEWFVSLSSEAKLLWLYLLTNDKINISGIYELTDREILFDTSINISDTSIKDELKPKVIFAKGWVRIVNVEKYNKYLNSPKNVTACIRELDYIPDNIKADLDIPLDTSIDTLRNKKQEIINNKQGTENQESEEERAERLKMVKDNLYKRMNWNNNL